MTLHLPTIPRSQLKPQPAKPSMPIKYLFPGELDVLIALVKSTSPRNVLEIGVNEGLTARAILEAIPTIECYQGIDVLPGYLFKCKVQSQEVPPFPGRHVVSNPKFELMIERFGSFDVSMDRINSCDVCFIDGDHSAKAVKWDTSIAMDRVRPGGLIIWHDYHDLGTVDVRDVLDDYARQGWPINHVEGTWLAYMRTTH